MVHRNKPEKLKMTNTDGKWKRAGPNGEVEVTIKGRRYMVEKALDHNERHSRTLGKAEYKIMQRNECSSEWEWVCTVQGKEYAKELVMQRLKAVRRIVDEILQDKAQDY